LHRGGADARAWAPNLASLAVHFTSSRAATRSCHPDGPDHFPVVHAKLAHTHWQEPTLTASDLGGMASRTLVMIGDDDEVTLEHAVAMYRASGRRSSRWCSAPRTACSTKVGAVQR
jgi:hypothetical protein